MSSIIVEGNYGSIDADFHGNYIIIFSSSPYTLQEDLSIDEKIISAGKIVCKGTIFFNPFKFSLLLFSKD